MSRTLDRTPGARTLDLRFCVLDAALTRVMKLNSAGASASLAAARANRPGGASFVLSAGKMSVSVSVPGAAGGDDPARNLQSIFFTLTGSFMTGRQRFNSTGREGKGEGRREGEVSGGRGKRNMCCGAVADREA